MSSFQGQHPPRVPENSAESRMEARLDAQATRGDHKQPGQQRDPVRTGWPPNETPSIRREHISFDQKGLFSYEAVSTD